MTIALKEQVLTQIKRLLAPPQPQTKVPALEEAIAEAHREWELARRYFETVSEPELVEHAAYLIKATERRYMFLVRLARSGDGEGASPSLVIGTSGQSGAVIDETEA